MQDFTFTAITAAEKCTIPYGSMSKSLEYEKKVKVNGP